MTIRIQDFIDKLKLKAKAWSQIGGTVGLRVIKFDGSFIRAALENDLAEDWLDRLFAQLPSDACLMDAGHSIMWVDTTSSGLYTDRYCLIVGSSEWEPLKEGEPIPELLPQFYKDAPHRDTVLPTIQLPPMAEGQTHWLIGNESGMYYSADKYGVMLPLSDWTCSNHSTPVPDIPKGEKCPVCGSGHLQA